MLRWWYAYKDWLAGDEVSLVTIPVSSNPINATRRLRKGLRDVRDRTARHDCPRWAGVAMAGLVDGDRALILIKHHGIDRAGVWTILERRWPEVGLCDPGEIEPSSVNTVEDAANIAREKRSIQPIRIVILPQGTAANDPWDTPMPMVF